MIPPLPSSDDVPLDLFGDAAAWSPVPRRTSMLDGPEGLRLRLLRNRDTLRAALSFRTIGPCAQRGGLWRRQETLGTLPVPAALFPGATPEIALRIADLAWGAGARRTHTLLGQIAQALAADERGPAPEDEGAAEAAEIAFTRQGARLRARRRNTRHPGLPFQGAWHDLPAHLRAHVLLGVLPKGGMITTLPAADVPETAHGRIALRTEARRAVAALGDDPASLFGDAA
jgi:hypothetical protein